MIAPIIIAILIILIVYSIMISNTIMDSEDLEVKFEQAKSKNSINGWIKYIQDYSKRKPIFYTKNGKINKVFMSSQGITLIEDIKESNKVTIIEDINELAYIVDDIIKYMGGK